MILVAIALLGAGSYMLDFWFWPEGVGQWLTLVLVIGPLYLLAEVASQELMKSRPRTTSGHKPPASKVTKVIYFLLGIFFFVLCLWGIQTLVKTYIDPTFFD